jgi:hypothetical protein
MKPLFFFEDPQTDLRGHATEPERPGTLTAGRATA